MKNKAVFGVLVIILIVSAVFMGVNATDIGESAPKRNVANKVQGKSLNTNEIQEDLIYSNKYLVKQNIIYRIEPKTSIEQFRKNIEVLKGKEIKIYKDDKEIQSGYIGTGMKLIEANGEEYTLSVIGDITGDGIANQVELTRIIRHLIGLKGWKLEGIELLSADITGEGEVNLIDLSSLIGYIVYGRADYEEVKTPQAPKINIISKKEENQDWYKKEVKLKIEAGDVENTAKTTYKISGDKTKQETEIKAGEIITIEGEGQYIITAYNYGKAGNKSKGQVQTIIIKEPVPDLTEKNVIIKYTTKDWTNGSVKVEIETTVEGDYKLQYSTDGKNWQDYTGEIEMEQNGEIHIRLEDEKGKVGNELVITVTNIDKQAPTVELSINGGNFVLPNTGKAKLNTMLTVGDLGGSGLGALQYAWSTSNTEEPTEWIDFTNKSKVEKTDITEAGTWYLWTKVTDGAGNRAEDVKISNAFIITESTDPANTITIEPNVELTEWTNEDITLKVEWGDNLTQGNKITCTGEEGKDYIINEDGTVIIKTNGTTVTVEGTDEAGNKIEQTITIQNIDKTAPVVTLSPNGGGFTLPSQGTAKINTTLTATDGEGSGLGALQYAWSTSNTEEPAEWINFTNGSKVEKTGITEAGTWYLWTKVLDNVGNRATNVKVSNAFRITSNTDPANQITITPDIELEEWTNGDVTVKVDFGDNLTQGNKVTITGEEGKDYIINEDGSITIKTNGTTITVEGKDEAGNVITNTITIQNIDKTAPVVTLSPNGGGFTLPSQGTAKINTTLTATDGEGSGLGTLQYAWSVSNTEEPLEWTNFTNGSKVEKTGITQAGNWYLWTKVIDRVGNRAESIKVSNPFRISANADVANTITLIANPTETNWTNGDVTVTASYGANLTQGRNLTCTGTAGTDYVVNGNTSVVVKTNGKTVTAEAKDMAGNIISESLTIDKIDKELPTMNSITASPETWTKGNVTLTGKATDQQSGIVAYQFSQNPSLIGTGSDNWTNIARTTSQITYTKEVSSIGTWYFYVKDAAGNVNKNSVIVYIDKTPPTMNSLTANPASWTNQNVTLTGKATDGQSGIVGWQFSQDANLAAESGGWTNLATPAKAQITQTKEVSANGTWYFYVKDALGNVNKNSVVVYIDKTLPAMNSLTATTTSWTNNNVTLTGKATDTQSGIVAYQFSQVNNLAANSGGWTNLTTATKTQITQNYTATKTGTWYFYVKDAAGNINKNSVTVNIDKAPPTITVNPTSTVSSTSDNYVKSTSVTITVADTGGSGLSSSNSLQYYLSTSSTALSGGAWTTYRSGTPFTIGTNLTGTYYLFVKRVVDNAGNTSTANGTATTISNTTYQRFGTYKFDNTQPVMNSLTPSQTTWTNGNVTLTGKATDEQSGIVAYQFSQTSNLTAASGGWTTITRTTSQTTQTFSATANGTWYFYVKDALGYINKSSVTVKIDKLAPTVNSVTTSEVTKNSVKITVTASDAVATTTSGMSGVKSYYYSKDGGKTWTEAQNSSIYTFTGLSAGTQYTFAVKVVDNAGKESAVKTVPETTEQDLPAFATCTGTPTKWQTAQSGPLCEFCGEAGINISCEFWCCDDCGFSFLRPRYDSATCRECGERNTGLKSKDYCYYQPGSKKIDISLTEAEAAYNSHNISNRREVALDD